MHLNNIHKPVFLLTDKSISKLLGQNKRSILLEISKAYWTGEGSTTEAGILLSRVRLGKASGEITYRQWEYLTEEKVLLQVSHSSPGHWRGREESEPKHGFNYHLGVKIAPYVEMIATWLLTTLFFPSLSNSVFSI